MRKKHLFLDFLRFLLIECEYDVALSLVLIMFRLLTP